MLVQPTVVELSAYVFAQTPDKSAARCCAFRPRRRPLVLVALCHCLDCQKRIGGTSGIAAFFSREHLEAEGESRRYRNRSTISVCSAGRRIQGAGAQARCDRGGRGFVRRSPVPSIIVNSLLALSMYMEIYSHPLAYALKRTKIDGLGRTLRHRFARRHRERQQITGGSNRSCRCCGKWLMLPMKGRNLRVALSERMLLHPYCV